MTSRNKWLTKSPNETWGGGGSSLHRRCIRPEFRGHRGGQNYAIYPSILQIFSRQIGDSKSKIISYIFSVNVKKHIYIYIHSHKYIYIYLYLISTTPPLPLHSIQSQVSIHTQHAIQLLSSNRTRTTWTSRHGCATVRVLTARCQLSYGVWLQLR